MAEPTYISRRQAIAVCRCSEDTLRRDQQAGRLPHTMAGEHGATLYAVADLVAAGRLDPLAAGDSIEAVAGRSRAERDLAVARTGLAVAEVRIAQLADALERSEGEVAFLRSLLRTGRAEVA